MEVAITGSTGLIGTALSKELTAAGHRVVPVTRHGDQGIHWDPARQEIDAASLEGMDVVVHLAGEGIADHRWTEQQKGLILSSRVDGTTLLAETLAGLARPPRALLSGSAIGYYGDRGDEVLDESAPQGEGFLAGVAAAWEAGTAAAEEAGIRVVHLRTGIVLATEGGVLKKMLPLYKLGLGGKLGSGQQYMSWISLADEVGIIAWLLGPEPEHAVAGPVNLTAPNPVTNAEFNEALGRALHRPKFLSVPKFGPKLLLGGQLAEELLFEGARVLPEAIQASGYQFVHPTIDLALNALLG
jgi:hypothetical protein